MNIVPTSVQKFDMYLKQFYVVTTLLTILTPFAKRTWLNAILQK